MKKIKQSVHMMRREYIILGMVIALYVAVFVVISGLRHYNFQSQTWDMGIFVQTMWNTIHGNFMENTLEEIPKHFGVHMSPFLSLLVPWYAVFKSPYTLLILQTLALALGAWPLYGIARRIMGEGRWPYLMVAGYLLMPSLHWINMFDFHEIAFFPSLFLAAWYCMEQKRWGWTYFWLTLAASTKEDAILIVAVVGLYLLVQKPHTVIANDGRSTIESRPWAQGLGILLVSILYFIIVVTLLMPLYGGGLVRLDRYAQFGATAGEIVKMIITNPGLTLTTMFGGQKLLYLFWLIVPFGFLPLFSGRVLILLVPGLFENLLTTQESQFSGLYQYDALLIGALWVTAVYGARNIIARCPARAIILRRTLAITIILGYFFRSPLNPLHFPLELFSRRPRWDAYREMVRLVPERISVAAHTNMVPHLAQREKIYMLGKEPFQVDMVLIDAQDGFGFADTVSFQKYVDSYVNASSYTTKIFGGRYVVAVKKGVTPR